MKLNVQFIKHPGAKERMVVLPESQFRMLKRTAMAGVADLDEPAPNSPLPKRILDKIAAALAPLGGRMEDVVQTRVYLADAERWEPVSRAHGRVFGGVLPANTLVQAGRLIGDYEVEIEAEAIIDGSD